MEQSTFNLIKKIFRDAGARVPQALPDLLRWVTRNQTDAALIAFGDNLANTLPSPDRSISEWWRKQQEVIAEIGSSPEGAAQILGGIAAELGLIVLEDAPALIKHGFEDYQRYDLEDAGITRGRVSKPAKVDHPLESEAQVARAKLVRLAMDLEVGQEAAKALQGELEDLYSESSKNLNTINQQIIAAQRDQANAVEELSKARETIEKDRAGISALFTDVQKYHTQFREQLAAEEIRLHAIQEGVNTLSVKKLWDQRATQSRIAFYVSASILAMLLLVIPMIALSNLDFVLSYLKHVADATTQGIPSGAETNATALAVTTISRLVVISVPLLLYMWVIRLLVRFNIRSLALMDDALQRHTMMDTYFHLIEQNSATREDRALVLAALFRPSPGVGPDNVDPPSFTELLDKGISKG